MVDDSHQLWTSGDAYERYVGRWSRLVAREFLDWIDAPPRKRWLDVGCGTGALSEQIVSTRDPVSVLGVDRSGVFAAFARDHAVDRRLAFAVGSADAMPIGDATFDIVVSGLVLNFVNEPSRAVKEFCPRVPTRRHRRRVSLGLCR